MAIPAQDCHLSQTVNLSSVSILSIEDEFQVHEINFSKLISKCITVFNLTQENILVQLLTIWRKYLLDNCCVKVFGGRGLDLRERCCDNPFVGQKGASLARLLGRRELVEGRGIDGVEEG